MACATRQCHVGRCLPKWLCYLGSRLWTVGPLRENVVLFPALFVHAAMSASSALSESFVTVDSISWPRTASGNGAGQGAILRIQQVDGAMAVLT